jgi:hypothetical protein
MQNEKEEAFGLASTYVENTSTMNQ